MERPERASTQCVLDRRGTEHAPGAEPYFFEIETVGHTPVQGVARVSACTYMYFPPPLILCLVTEWRRAGAATKLSAKGPQIPQTCEIE